MEAEPNLGNGDDTGTNGLRVTCRGPGLSGTHEEQLVEEGTTFTYSAWGSWSGQCVPGSAICSIQTKIQSDQGDWSDDSALTDVKFFCCIH